MIPATTPAITAEEIAEMERAHAAAETSRTLSNVETDRPWRERQRLVIPRLPALFAEARSAATLRADLAAAGERVKALEAENKGLQARLELWEPRVIEAPSRWTGREDTNDA